MTFNLRDNVPAEALDENGEFSLKRYMEHAGSCTALADQIAAATDVALVEHRVLILVDLQGVYLALVDWLKERNFRLESGLILSRFTIFMLTSVLKSIENDVMEEAGDGAITFDDLVQLISNKNIEQMQAVKTVVKMQPKVELFYAPAPLADIRWRLQKNVKNGGREVFEQLEGVEKGIVRVHGRERDYRHYQDFVDALKHDPLVTRSERGFFNLYVGPRGLQFFDEKEVDIRIVIRAVDACIEYEAESICIVSSDQDFVPLHERCSQSGTKTYQADVAKFASQEKVGRKIRELGTGFIPTGVDPEWPLRAIIGAIAPFAIYRISLEELEGLCGLHNGLNEVQISPHPLDGGGMGLRMHRPA